MILSDQLILKEIEAGTTVTTKRTRNDSFTVIRQREKKFTLVGHTGSFTQNAQNR